MSEQTYIDQKKTENAGKAILATVVTTLLGIASLQLWKAWRDYKEEKEFTKMVDDIHKKQEKANEQQNATHVSTYVLSGGDLGQAQADAMDQAPADAPDQHDGEVVEDVEVDEQMIHRREAGLDVEEYVRQSGRYRPKQEVRRPELDEEMEKVKAANPVPYAITEDQYTLGRLGFAKVYYTYYTKDDVLLDSSGEKVGLPEVSLPVGWRKFFGLKDEEIADTLFVRNEKLELDILVSKVERSHAVDVLGVVESPAPKTRKGRRV